MDASDAKRAMRARLLAAREGLGVEARRAGSAAIVGHLLRHPAFGGARRVVGFVATPTEPDPAAALAAAAAWGVAVYLPRTIGDRLEFVLADPGAGHRPGPHGVPEPEAAPPLPERGGGAVVLVPGVGFDPAGTRLGRGGGWYDRALDAHPRAVRIGIAWDVCIVPALPHDPWDVRMHLILTESRVLGPGVPGAGPERETGT